MKAALLIACLALAGCTATGGTKGDNNPLLATECPEQLPELTDNTFGGTTEKLVEVAGIYHRCRRAALAGQD